MIVSSPDFLRGSSSPHPANDEKDTDSTKGFGLWKGVEYLEIKEERIVRRDILP